MEQQQVINEDTVFNAATEHILYSGCDYTMFWVLSGICFLMIPCLLRILGLPGALLGWAAVLVFWLAAREGLRALARYDSLAVPIYWRHIQWPKYLNAHGKVLTHREPLKIARSPRL